MTMAECKDIPISVKVDEHSQSVVLTYFQGDIGSEVDAHFSRALNKIQMAKTSMMKTNNKRRKSVKSEDSSTCQWSADPSTSYSETPFQPLSRCLVTTSAKAGHSGLPCGSVASSAATSWTALPARQSGGLGLPPLSYSLGPEGLSLTGQQCATSLLNLLHSDRPEVGASMGSAPSKPELLSSWMPQASFRDPLDPAIGFESGRSLDKKDMYWY